MVEQVRPGDHVTTVCADGHRVTGDIRVIRGMCALIHPDGEGSGVKVPALLRDCVLCGRKAGEARADSPR